MSVNIEKLISYGILPKNFDEVAKQRFEEYDKNKNGYLEYNECADLIMEVAEFMGYESFFQNEETKTKLFEGFDQNGDKKFDYNEFKEKLAYEFINHYEEKNKKKYIHK